MYIYINNTGHSLFYWLPRSTPSLTLITLLLAGPTSDFADNHCAGGNCMGIATIVAR